MDIKAGSEHARRLLQAAADGRVEELREANDEELRTTRCSSGCTALHWAAGANQQSVMAYLLEERSVPVDIKATKKAKNRTPLHYAARNGCLEAARLLIARGADVDARAKHGVSPFQLAVWQNHLPICRYFVEDHGVDASQLNDFDCGAVHWIGLCPIKQADGPDGCEGENLFSMVQWLATLPAVDFTVRQRQGHSALHKAAWGGHVALLRWLRNECGLWDDSQDYAGNYAADLADMANDERHEKVARFLRRECSSARQKSCSTLGVTINSSDEEIRQAYLAKAKELHPDRSTIDVGGDDFDEIRRAYDHLTKEAGIGKQANPAHSLKLMLEFSGASKSEELDEGDCFKARLLAVLLEYGDKGLDLSNVGKKWTQVWPGTPHPWEAPPGQQRRKGVLLDYIRKHAGDVVNIVSPQNGGGQTRIVPRNCRQSQVAAAAEAV